VDISDNWVRNYSHDNNKCSLYCDDTLQGHASNVTKFWNIHYQ
jgi:hypothetical protein